MPRYKVRDESTGKVVEFEWHAQEPPTEADMAEVFSAAAPQAPEPSWRDLPGNILPSVGRVLGDAAQGAWGLAKTVTPLGGLVDLAKGQRPGTGFQQSMETAGTLAKNPGAVVRGLTQAIGDRYGSLDAAKRTLIEDPAGVAADASAVLSLGGSAAARAPGVLGRVGRGMQTAASAVDPLANVVRAGSALDDAARVVGLRPTDAGFRESGRKWMQSAVKVNEVNERENPFDIPTEMIKRNIMPTERGSARNQRALRTLKQEKNARLAAADDAGAVVNPDDVVREMDALIAREPDVSGLPEAQQAALRKVRDEFYRNNSQEVFVPDGNEGIIANPRDLPLPYGERVPVVQDMVPTREAVPIPVSKADRFTQKANRSQSGQWGRRTSLSMLTEPTESVEAKNAYRGILKAKRDSAVDAAVGTEGGTFGELQTERGTRLGIEKQLRRTLRREENKERLPFRVVVGGAAAGAGAYGATQDPLLASAALMLPYLIDKPIVKGRIARGMYYMPERLAGLHANAAGLAPGASRLGAAEQVTEDAIRNALLDAMDRSTEIP